MLLSPVAASSMDDWKSLGKHMSNFLRGAVHAFSEPEGFGASAAVK